MQGPARFFSALAFPLLLALAGAQDAPSVPKLGPAIEAATLEAHVRYLASDELGGRDTATPGIEKAARYLAAVLEGQGLEPVGDDGFFQTVPLVRSLTLKAPELSWVDAAGAEHVARAGVDFDVSGGGGSTESLELFVVARDANLDDPPEGAALFIDGRGEQRRLEQSDGQAFARHPVQVLPGSPREGKPWEPSGPGGLQRQSVDKVAGEPIQIRVRADLAQRFEQGEVQALRIVQHTELEKIDCRNVVARIPGVGTPERPELAKEVVVLTAHYDHIGVNEKLRAAGEADFINNGADDDASGVAAVLEIAHALATGSPPARTVMVLLVTGEEIGLLGTHYYIENPLAPLERTVANLNFEMLGRPDTEAGGPGKLWFTGPERTNLMHAFKTAGVPVVEDPRPTQGFFYRSDNIAFAYIGIVAQTLSSYGMHDDYHKVTDEADTLDYAHMETAVEASLGAVRLVTDGKVDPAWLPGGMPKPR